MNRFITIYEKFVLDHKLVEKACALRSCITYPINERDQKMYEWLDQMQLIGIAKAEYHCRKLRMGGVAYCLGTIKS